MTEFEVVSDILNKGDYEQFHENCIFWLDGDKQATVNFNTNSRYATRLRKLAEQYPDECKVFSDKNGVIVGTVPVKAIKMSIVNREWTDEERAKVAMRFQNLKDASNTMDSYADFES